MPLWSEAKVSRTKYREHCVCGWNPRQSQTSHGPPADQQGWWVMPPARQQTLPAAARYAPAPPVRLGDFPAFIRRSAAQVLEERLHLARERVGGGGEVVGSG